MGPAALTVRVVRVLESCKIYNQATLALMYGALAKKRLVKMCEPIDAIVVAEDVVWRRFV